MKIQCPCGTKLAFDITPEMATNPVSFVCPVCGLDSSATVNEIVRQQLGLAAATDGAPAPAPVPAPARMRIATPTTTSSPAPAPAPVPLPVPSAAPKPAMRIATHFASAAPSAAPTTTATADSKFCLKHPGQEIAHKCNVCAKPMCPECMELFGYVCSPRCRNNAEARGVDIPVYAMQKSVVEANKWKKISRIGGGIGAVVALVLGFWFWYSWFGCKPRVSYAMRFEQGVNNGELHLCGTNHLVFIRDGELGRIDMKSGAKDKPVWSKQLVDKTKFGPLVDAAIVAATKAEEEHIGLGGDKSPFKLPPRDKMIDEMFDDVVGAMQLHVADENIWVLAEDKMTRFDWQTGAVSKEVALEGSTYDLQRIGNELVSEETDYEDPTIKISRHINLLTGETRTETTQKPIPPRLMELLIAASTNKAKVPANNRTAAKTVAATAKKIITANEAARPDAPLDPQKIAEQSKKMTYAGKIALPVLIANARNQQRLFAEMSDYSGENAPRRQPSELELALNEWDSSRVIQAADGPVQFSRVLLERKLIAREAMKAAPRKPALNENVSAGNSLEAAQDLLNEMQREAGSTVTENVSRYKVTVRRSGADIPEWTGEVTGSPAIFALKTMDIITAGTKAIAIDHSNKKLWEATLNFPVTGGDGEFEDLFDDEDASGASESGLGPCVERDDTVFIYDKGSLAAFDRNTGEARWRLPSVGIAGLWFDDKGMLYVNTTTAGGDSIRYSKQINVNDQAVSLILKVDPKTGKTLWDCRAAKHIAYMWKKYIYTTDQFVGTDSEDLGAAFTSGTKPFLRIRRIDASNGRVVWEHRQERCPLDLHFHENSIQLMFKKEVQHLKILML